MNVLTQWFSNHRSGVKLAVIVALAFAIGEFWNPYERLAIIMKEAVKVVSAPTTTVRTVAYHSPAANPAEAQRTYRVKPNDTLTKISEHFNVSISSIVFANDIDPKGILPAGKELTIPNG